MVAVDMVLLRFLPVPNGGDDARQGRVSVGGLEHRTRLRAARLQPSQTLLREGPRQTGVGKGVRWRPPVGKDHNAAWGDTYRVPMTCSNPSQHISNVPRFYSSAAEINL